MKLIDHLIREIKIIAGLFTQTKPSLQTEEPISPLVSNAENQITFLVKHVNANLFETTLKDFPGIFGQGVTPEQSLSDLLAKITSKIDTLVRATLLTSINKEELHSKYSQLSKKYLHKSETYTASFFKQLFNIISSPFKKPAFFEVTINLKNSLQQDMNTEKANSKRFPPINFSKLSYPVPRHFERQVILPPHNSSQDQRIYLRTDEGEIPINLLIDQEGNHSDEMFSFGIVINLN